MLYEVITVMKGTTTTIFAALEAGQLLSDLDLSQYVVPIGEAFKLIPIVKNFIVDFICGKFNINQLSTEATYDLDISETLSVVMENRNNFV